MFQAASAPSSTADGLSIEGSPAGLDRDAWLDAGCALLALGRGVFGLTPLALADAAAQPVSRYIAEFREHRNFLAALLQRLLHEIVDETVAATHDQTPSLRRMCIAIWANLDAHLRRPAVRALYRALRGHEAAQHIKQTRSAGAQMAFQMEFRVVGVPHEQAHARIVNAMVLETAGAEHEAGHALPMYREALCAYLKSLRS